MNAVVVRDWELKLVPGRNAPILLTFVFLYLL